MNKAIYTLFFLVFSFSLYAKSGRVKLSGKVTNPTETSVKITFFDYEEVVSADLDAKGNFTLSVKIEDGFYLLNYGRHTAYIYLYPKDELTLSFDAKYFDKTLAFEGKGSERNNYLAKKSLIDAELTEDLETFYKVEEAIYMENINKVKQTHLDNLTKYEVEDFFMIAEEKSLEYARLLSIQNYKSNYKFYLGQDIEPSSEFYQPIEDVKLNKEEDYNKQPYYRYLVNSIWNKKIEAAPTVDDMFNELRKVPLRETLISLVNGFYSKISSTNERSKDYLDLIKKITTHKPFIEAAEKRYAEVMSANSLKKGDDSPQFSYEAIDGKIVNLSDLKGKYVYIDVWATWCAPCIKQVPYLKKLEERYQNNNIVFVSISVDKKPVKDTWKQFVADKQLGGLQLFADKSFDSDFMNALAVNSIPRFILIDPEGKIVDPEAPRPSFDKTITLLDELLN
ncbi:MAG: TlpA disulfide reductase family protein [Bacteroidota bacterium]